MKTLSVPSVFALLIAGTAVYADTYGLLTVVNDNPDLTPEKPKASSPQELVDKFNLGYPIPEPRRALDKPANAIRVYRGWDPVLVKKAARREDPQVVFAAMKARGKLQEDDLLGLATELEMSVANTRRHLRHLAGEGHIMFDAQAGYYFAR
jgi:hypothetical protein